jgi:heat-inducible transcriptional repressor
MKRDEGRMYKVLFSVVRDYIKRKKPVSSKRVLDITELNWSSATIRNDLKRLEELGYLYQPHTSAGRIPTDKGLRFYLEELLSLKEEFKKEDMGIDISQRFPIGDLEMILNAIARILSKAGKGLAVVTKPSLEKMRLVRVTTAPIAEKHIAVAIITELGISRVIPVPRIEGVIGEAIERFFNIFSGRTLYEVVQSISRFVPDNEGTKVIIDVARAIVDIAMSEGRVVYKGVYELMKESNHGVEGVVKILEETRKLENLLKNIEKTGVFIGTENEIEEFRNFSLFVSPYFKDKEIVGHVALITDKFVEYERIYSLIEFTANRLTEYLTVTSRR